MQGKKFIERLQLQISQLDWKILVFLVLVLNVKLVVKIVALLFFTIIERKEINFKNIFRQRYLFFYFGMIGIGLINLLLQYKAIHLPYLLVSAMGIFFWLLAAAAAYHAFHLVQKTDWVKLNNSVTLFFLVHIGLIFFHLLMIMWETGSINPYTYKGLNQKYYLSTGDSIPGITFDSPVTTATICAFGVLFFLYRKRYLFSLLCMTGLLIIVSNLTNIFLAGSFVVAFIFRSDKVQKSMMMVFVMMMVVFISKTSPQNNEYVVSFIYKLIGKAYYLPPVKSWSNAELKQANDSLLTMEQRRKKVGLIYIDSINGIRYLSKTVTSEKNKISDSTPVNASLATTNRIFNEYRPSASVKEKENRYGIFLKEQYTQKQRDSLHALYDWEKPGKGIAYKEVVHFIRTHPGKIALGAGIGNFSSRAAFKATALDIAGTYPEKYRYIHPDFMNDHLYLYLYYHSQWQIKHTAANTPDSVYNQLLGEYGIVGLLFFLLFFIGYYFRRIPILSYGLPMLCLLLSSFFVEYWFEQLSVVILFELLLFMDIRASFEKEKKV